MCFYGLLGSSFSLLPAWRANTTERRTVDRRNEKKKSKGNERKEMAKEGKDGGKDGRKGK